MKPLWHLLSKADKYPQFAGHIIEALEAGLWGINPRHLEIDCLPRPVIQSRRGRLHASNGPAVLLGDTAAFFWDGVNVEERVILFPETIQAKDVATEWNIERRRILLERIGYERYIRESNAVLVSKDRFGELYRIIDREDTTLVVVTNGSPEPDGTFKKYFLRVPPGTRTPKEAVAWTYGLTAEQYKPVIRT